MFDRFVEHRRRVVDPDHLVDSELRGGERGQLPRPAAEVDGSLDRPGLDQSDKVVERLGALGGESSILLRVPISHDLYCTCIASLYVKLSGGTHGTHGQRGTH
jgi:hypothetical protein